MHKTGPYTAERGCIGTRVLTANKPSIFIALSFRYTGPGLGPKCRGDLADTL